MVRITRTHQPVTRVLHEGVTTGVPDRRLQYALVLRGWVVLQKDMLDAPEAARGKRGDFGGSGRHCQCKSGIIVSPTWRPERLTRGRRAVDRGIKRGSGENAS